VQLYYTVVKDIALTDGKEVSTCKSLRKVEKDEIIEVIQGPQADEKSGLQRIRGRALLDGMEGWITLQGNQGTPFLKESPKPFYVCKTDTQMEPGRTIKDEEILELLEGPKMEQLPDLLRAKVKTTSADAVTGWVVLRGRCGTVFAEANKKLFVCTSSVAMTDAQNINDCKVVRKLAVGELFETIGEAVEDAASKVWRIEGKAVKDGKPGWITTKGSAGTVFAEATTKYYSVQIECSVQKTPKSDAESLKTLKVGETFELLERPKEEKAAPQVRIKCRAVKDSIVGWVLGAGKTVVPWVPIYKCLKATQLQNQQAVEGAEVLAEVALGEKVELYDGPVEDGAVLRIQAKVVKDGSVGWLTLKDAEGKKIFGRP